MGRGRQRAKQRKVARNLKYYSPETDYAALERELVGGSEPEYEADDEFDKWADYDPDAEFDPDAYEIPPATD
ncbi:DUF3073 domain-containing protein [Trueperella sp. LYQ143]|uniref:DUF3073 domain-containing protein n=1 Tax=unclassified Trueperella TaxID=2630174 RepID=UPI003982ED7E